MDICFWDNNYIFATFNGSAKTKFILVNLNTKEIEKEFYEIKMSNCYGIHLLKHKTEGSFLITFTSGGKLYLYKL